MDEKSEINDAMAAVLRAEKSAQKLSVRVLAERTGLKPVTLNRILNNQRDITATQITLLAKAFEVTPQKLMTQAVDRLGGMDAIIVAADARAEQAGITREELSVAPDNVTHLRPDTAEEIDNYRGAIAANRDEEADTSEPD